MKVIMCVVSKKEAPRLLAKLEEAEYRVTQLTSEGGFLKQGNTTFMIGVEDEQTDDVLAFVQESSATGRGQDDRLLAIVLSAQAGGEVMHDRR